MLSTVIAPGVGQFVQRRWLAGAGYLVAFLVCLLFLLSEIVGPMVRNILIGIDFATQKSDVPFVPFRVAAILAWLGLALAVYLAGLLDTWLAYSRQCREWARRHSRLGAVTMPKDER